MRKIKRNNKPNQYFLGGLVDKTDPNKLSLAVNISNAVINTASGLIPSSGNAKTDTITNGISAAATTIGSAFGPVGGLVGSAVGGIAKGIGALVGTSDSVNTDTGEYIKGKGIKGRRSRSRVLAQVARVRQGIQDLNLTIRMQEEWANEHGDNDYSLAAYGGILPTTLAYLDDGELMRTPDGEISQIPEQGKPTDSNLVNVPVGTQVLSDKLKVPGTNETFAQAGKKYMKTGKKKGNDIYALNTQMLNDRNNLKKYNELLALQELMKRKRSIKNKIGKYDKGSDGVSNVQSASDLNWGKDIMKSPWFDSTLSMITPDNYLEYNQLQSLYTLFNFGDTKPGNVKLTPSKDVETYQGLFDNRTDLNAAIGDLYKNKRLIGRGGSLDKPETWRDGLAGDATWLRHLGRNVTPEQLKYINDRLSGVEAYVDNSKDSQGNDKGYGMVKFRPIVKPVERNIHPTLGNFEMADGTIFNPSNIKVNINKTSPIPKQNNDPKNRSINISEKLGDILSNGAALIGPMANIYNSDPEKAKVFTYSPHFAPVDYDISPILREIDMTNAIARYNANQAGGFGRSANLAQAVQSQVARNRAIAQAYNQKNNVEDGRKARNIGIYNDWARYNTEAFHRGYEEDAQNRAAARTIRNTGLSQLGTALQSMSRDNRLNKRDQAMLEYMREFFNYGSTQDTVNKLYRNFR